jgi:broad specificity phosphatase PhoE
VVEFEMGSVTLIRHGQAAFLSDDYDRLSQLGEAQAKALGQYWIAQDVAFDRIFTGPRVRQARTARIVAETIKESGKDWPDAETIPELDEYDADAIVGKLLPVVLEFDERVRALKSAYDESRGAPAEHKVFQKLFEAVTSAWIVGEHHPEGLESWRDFTARVRRAINGMVAGDGSGRRIAAFTSGGPISATLQLALNLSDQHTIAMNWRVKNASLTEFVFSGGARFTLDSFNCLPHLPDTSLWSYR